MTNSNTYNNRRETNKMDIIFKENDKWYFWDETWSNKEGPYETRRECEIAVNGYAWYLQYQGIKQLLRNFIFWLKEQNYQNLEGDLEDSVFFKLLESEFRKELVRETWVSKENLH